MKPSRIAFLFTGSRRERLRERECATEFFYGSLQLQRRGELIDFLQEEDFGLDRPYRRWLKVPRVALQRATGVNPSRLRRLALPSALTTLNSYDFILVSANNLAFELAALRAAGLLRAKVIAIVVGALPLGASSFNRLKIRQLLKQVHVTVLSRSERLDQQKRLGSDIQVGYLPFGVDHEFWHPSTEAVGDYALSIGNTHRDFEVLVRAWRPEFPLLKIVTRCQVPVTQKNIEVVAGHWRSRVLTDVAVRDLTQRARLVLVPLQQVVHPAGQSATLQAMSCARPVVLTRTAGIWDNQALRSGENCFLVAPGSVQEMQGAIQKLVEDPAFANRMGQQARQVVTESYNCDTMAEGLSQTLRAAGAAMGQ